MQRFVTSAPARLPANGPPTLLIHGFLGTPDSWNDVARVLDDRAVRREWLPFHGSAPWSPRGLRFDDIVDELADEMASHGPQWLVGYSLGGRLCLALALRYPNRVRGAVLVGAHPGLLRADERADRANRDEALADRLEAFGVAAFVDAWEAQPLFATQQRLASDLLAGQRAARLSHTPAVANALRVLGLGRMPSLWDELLRARLPLIFVAGALDSKFAALAARAAAAAPGARVELVGGVGHNVGLEDAASLATIVRGAAAAAG